MMAGNILWTLRAAIGDFSIISIIKNLSEAESIIFWIAWLIVVFSSCVVFLNFIVAEVSASYSKVTDCLEQTIMQGKCSMIAEAETMMWSKL